MTAQPIVSFTRTPPGRAIVPGAEVRILGDSPPSREALHAFIRGSSVVVTMYTDRVDAAFLDAAGPNLRGVCNFAVGHENIDLAACAARGVLATNTPHAVTEGTADLAWSLVLAAARRLIEADRYARSPAYAANGPLGMADFLGQDLTGRTLLIVGAGRIGLAVAMRSRGWGMRVLYVARTRHWEFELAPLAAQRVTLDEGLAQADVVSIHCPLTPQTRGLINARALALMKPSAILVNTARGPIVDEGALVEALDSGRLYAAGLDVFEREPLVHPGLVANPRAVLTPHIGSAAARYREMMTEMVCENAAAIIEGRRAPNLITESHAH
ncbi:MAG: D-glycerate dehydrogenase [Phycisphaeraceae bacterium]|nr:D-glycerate dehydrogenase [Phycisphaeraceae bacterium]